MLSYPLFCRMQIAACLAVVVIPISRGRRAYVGRIHVGNFDWCIDYSSYILNTAVHYCPFAWIWSCFTLCKISLLAHFQILDQPHKINQLVARQWNHGKHKLKIFCLRHSHLLVLVLKKQMLHDQYDLIKWKDVTVTVLF